MYKITFEKPYVRFRKSKNSEKEIYYYEKVF